MSSLEERYCDIVILQKLRGNERIEYIKKLCAKYKVSSRTIYRWNTKVETQGKLSLQHGNTNNRFNLKLTDEVKDRALQLLSENPWLRSSRAKSEFLASQGIKVSRETVRRYFS